MDLFEYRKNLKHIFAQNSIDEQEVDILLCEALQVGFADLFKGGDISQKDAKKIQSAVKKRLLGEPIQKIFHRAYFFDFVFYVNKNVLCPRPETELLVEESLRHIDSRSNVLDLCTGSGAIGVTIAKKANAVVTASDVSKKALYVAKKNAKKYGADIKFVESDMFEKIKQKFDVIVSNPPYIPTRQCALLTREVKDYDPILSLDGGQDGLDFYRIICKNARAHLNAKGQIFLEVGIGEAQTVAKMFENVGFLTKIKKDYAGIERIVIGELI